MQGDHLGSRREYRGARDDRVAISARTTSIKMAALTMSAAAVRAVAPRASVARRCVLAAVPGALAPDPAGLRKNRSMALAERWRTPRASRPVPSRGDRAAVESRERASRDRRGTPGLSLDRRRAFAIASRRLAPRASGSGARPARGIRPKSRVARSLSTRSVRDRAPLTSPRL